MSEMRMKVNTQNQYTRLPSQPPIRAKKEGEEEGDGEEEEEEEEEEERETEESNEKEEVETLADRSRSHCF
jgi:hypothetical protein